MSKAKRFLQIAVRFFEILNNLSVIVSCLCILGLMFITVYHTAKRYYFDTPTTWFFELTEYAMLYIIFLPLAYAQQLKKHISVDFFTMRASKKMLTRMEIAISALSLFFWIVFTWSAYRYFHKALEDNWHSVEGLDWPQWVILIVMPVSGCLLSLQLIGQLVRHIADLFAKNQDNDKQETPTSSGHVTDILLGPQDGK